MRRLLRKWAIVLAAATATHATLAEVVLHEDERGFRIGNGRLQCTIRKDDARLTRLILGGRDLLEGGSGYWSIVGNSGTTRTSGFGTLEKAWVTIDPQKSDGTRAEVAMRFRGTGRDGGFPGTFESRYSLDDGGTSVRVAGVLSHGKGDRFCRVAEARYAMKLSPGIFNHLSIDADRDRDMPAPDDWEAGTELSLKEARRITTGRFAGQVEHKYAYSAILADLPAFGWSGTKERHGVWFINPSAEYIAGGCTKMELTGHLDVGSGARPTLLNMWHGSHYGATELSLKTDENWTKVVGPFTIHCNEGDTPARLWEEAKHKGAEEQKAWPFDWFDHPAYPKSGERGGVAGTLRISSEHEDDTPQGTFRVGLTAPDEVYGGGRWRSVTIPWQRDGKHLQFWTTASPDGGFRIQNVPPGNYVLRAFVDGVAGEFEREDIAVEAGELRNLGTITWKPGRSGRTLWQIGTANRSAREFRNGDRYWKWGNHLEYRKAFPDGVVFDVETSDPATDWHICQPLDLDPDGRVLGPSEWKVRFDCPEAPPHGAVLRIGFCGTRARARLDLGLNGKSVGSTGSLPEAGVMHRDSHRGWSFERTFEVPADLLRATDNELILTLRGREWHQGVLYDFLRLEAREAKPDSPR